MPFFIKISGEKLRDASVSEFATISEATAALDQLKAEFIIIKDSSGRIAGFISDAEVRAASLRDVSPSEPASRIANTNFIITKDFTNNSDASAAKLVIVVDAAGEPAEAHFATIPNESLPSAAVVMAGGLGTRMGNLTEDLPKPLIRVGARALIEHVLVHLAKHGIADVTIAVNYLANKIEEHVGCGARYGVGAKYLKEQKRLGTAGALSLLDPVPEKAIFIMNADVITKLNLRAMARAHAEAGAAMTVAVLPHMSECPFGVVKLNDQNIIDIIEKPKTRNWINAGIYIISPSILRDIPRQTYVDMTTMIQKLVGRGEPIIAFPIREYWHDAGTPEDLRRVAEDLTKSDNAPAKK